MQVNANAGIVNPPNARRLRANQNGGRLSRTSAAVLNFAPYSGEVIEINDELVDISQAGFDANVASTTISFPDGDDSGSPPSEGQAYGVFLSNTQEPTNKLQLRLCENRTGVRGTSGQKYLSTTALGKNWRCVGSVYFPAGSGPGFTDTARQRFVNNFDNKRPRSLFANPAYNNNNAQTNVVGGALANFGPLNGGVNDLVEWIAELDEMVFLTMHALIVLGPVGVSQWGIGFNDNISPSVSAQVAAAAANVVASCSFAGGTAGETTANFASILAATGAGATWCADVGRHGATSDAPGTHIAGWVLG